MRLPEWQEHEKPSGFEGELLSDKPIFALFAASRAISIVDSNTVSRERRETAKNDRPKGRSSSTVRCEGELQHPSTDLRVLRGFACGNGADSNMVSRERREAAKETPGLRRKIAFHNPRQHY